MNLSDGQTYYDVLDISPDASPQDIREAYIRIKETYNRDSVALYTLVLPEEREEILRNIEDAYNVLSSPDKRRNYDQNHGFLPSHENPFARQEENLKAKEVVSIDRVPPMENSIKPEDILIPPTTDFCLESSSSSKNLEENITTNPPPHDESIPNRDHSASNVVSAATFGQPRQPSLRNAVPKQYTLTEVRSEVPELDPKIVQEIETESEWRGHFLRKIRDAYQISIEEMSGITKVTKNYLAAIEEENYLKLPAPVYVRGFVMQMAKVLKLPAEKVSSAYLARYVAKRAEIK